jgi:hypothetical protein
MAEKPKVLANERRYPLQGLAAPYGMLDVGTVRFVGSGLVGTAFGIPGMGATRIGTGLVRVTIPRAHSRPSPAHVQKFNAQYVNPTGFQGPTGLGMAVQVVNRAPASGTFDLFTVGVSTGFGGTPGIPTNPPAQSEIDVWVFTTPLTKY